MLGGRGWWVGAAFVLSACAAGPPRPVLPGHYSSVSYVAEADDYVGMQLEYDRQEVRFALCEGVCPLTRPIAARLEGGAIVFDYGVQTRDQQGRPLPLRTWRVEVRRHRFSDSVVVTIPELAERQVLKALRE